MSFYTLDLFLLRPLYFRWIFDLKGNWSGITDLQISDIEKNPL